MHQAHLRIMEALVGQLGNLFSPKPGVGGTDMSPFHVFIDTPSKIMSMIISSRKNTNSNINSMTYNPPPSSSRPGRGDAGDGGMMYRELIQIFFIPGGFKSQYIKKEMKGWERQFALPT
jgi:hypothetical protein